jgi:TATA-box binding protein (TBP) (component of TFIID and TFIIIB)
MTNNIKWENHKFIDYLNTDVNEIKNLPNGISISTMCTSCKFDTKIDINNIEKYLQLNQDDILTVKRNKESMRSLITVKIKPKRMKKIELKVPKKDTSKNSFYNQITVVVRVDQGPVDDLNLVPKINLKLFKNGSVQMSGCKSIKNINIALNKLLIRLKEVKAKFEAGAIIEKAFVEDISSLKVKDFKIDMINSNYQVSMQIDRAKLYNLLQKKKIKSSYEPCIRACVIIKYIPEKDNKEMKEVSVFIFQKGNIIITGARSQSHIISAYNYMNDILLTHKNDIIKKDEKEEEDLILDIYQDIMNDIDIGLIKL